MGTPIFFTLCFAAEAFLAYCLYRFIREGMKARRETVVMVKMMPDRRVIAFRKPIATPYEVEGRRRA